MSYILKVRRSPPLTRREIECLYWVSQGKTARDVADILGLSIHTSRWYLKSIRLKLDCHNMSQAITKFADLTVIQEGAGHGR